MHGEAQLHPVAAGMLEAGKQLHRGRRALEDQEIRHTVAAAIEGGVLHLEGEITACSTVSGMGVRRGLNVLRIDAARSIQRDVG
jgi:hypothetical protein